MPAPDAAAESARTAGRDALRSALIDARQRTLGLLAAYADALGPALRVPYSAELNPPLWEAGHVAWFHDYWIARSAQRHLGIACEPDHARPPGRMPGADALYNSSVVAHAARWQLPLPDLQSTRDFLAASLEETLALLAASDDSEASLYCFRLGLFHEDMHAEAAAYMAQALDIPLPAAWRPAAAPLPEAAELRIAGRRHRLGYEGTGFAFDNELPPMAVDVDDFAIDRTAVSWARFLPAVADGAVSCPRYLRLAEGQWQRKCHGVWQAIDPRQAATHITWSQADDWCRWAGRRLPSEAEWEVASLDSAAFDWGEVWEWTASRFAPFPGFVAHPYRDYSRFGCEEDRYVLKGASRATTPRMAHRRYRNFFTPERADVHTGFRSCAR